MSMHKTGCVINKGDNMKNKGLINFAAVSLSALLLTSCSIGDLDIEIQTQTDPETETKVTTTATTSEETQVETYEDIDSQLAFIAGKYTDLYDYYVYDESVGYNALCAITDLNHNGRLEVLLTCCVGSAAQSYTVVYEISEDYTDLVNLKFSGDSPNDPGDAGDFCDWQADQINIEVYDCYMKNGKYYYLVDDYATIGWSDKYIGFYSYTFDKTVRKDIIGSAAVHIPEGEYTILTHLGNSRGRFNEDEYFETVNSYWDGYEKQKSVEVKWFTFSDETGFADNVKDSWKAFNPESDKSSDVEFDYQAYFGRFYSDEYEFEVQE